jgi:prevent-host-death family protein
MSAALSMPVSMPASMPMHAQPFQLGSTLGAFDAKTHFSRILEMVSKGKEFIVTKHGRAVAKISPAQDTSALPSPEVIAKRREAIEWMKNNRIKLAPGQTIRELIDEGKR